MQTTLEQELLLTRANLFGSTFLVYTMHSVIHDIVTRLDYLCAEIYRVLISHSPVINLCKDLVTSSISVVFGLFVSLVYCAESTVRWFVVREKHCWMTADSADKSKRTGLLL
jgi:hypothetical protein